MGEKKNYKQTFFRITVPTQELIKARQSLLQVRFRTTPACENIWTTTPGGETPHMKGVGMLVVSLRGVNFGFWSRLGCSGQNTIIFSRKGLF